MTPAPARATLDVSEAPNERPAMTQENPHALAANLLIDAIADCFERLRIDDPPSLTGLRRSAQASGEIALKRIGRFIAWAAEDETIDTWDAQDIFNAAEDASLEGENPTAATELICHLWKQIEPELPPEPDEDDPDTNEDT